MSVRLTGAAERYPLGSPSVSRFAYLTAVALAGVSAVCGAQGGNQSSLRTYPPAGDHREVTVRELRADTLPPGTYNVTAIVHNGRRCPRCPAGVNCPSCSFDQGIMVNDMADAATHLVFIAVESTSQLQVGVRYRFSVLVSDPRKTPYPGRLVLTGLDRLPP